MNFLSTQIKHFLDGLLQEKEKDNKRPKHEHECFIRLKKNKKNQDNDDDEQFETGEFNATTHNKPRKVVSRIQRNKSEN